MSDTEALNLIEHNSWSVLPMRGRPLTPQAWVVLTDGGPTEPRPTLREAVSAALAKQVAWAQTL